MCKHVGLSPHLRLGLFRQHSHTPQCLGMWWSNVPPRQIQDICMLCGHYGMACTRAAIGAQFKPACAVIGLQVKEKTALRCVMRDGLHLYFSGESLDSAQREARGRR